MRKPCKGDGKTDDTACFQRILDNAGSSSIVYVDAGTYTISDTITVPKDVRVVGEVWSQIAAFGRNFGDAKSPRPLFKVGQPDEMGSVQMQDLLFTNKGNTPGVIFVEWNVRAAAPGEAGMWDCHVRVGGAVGTELESKQCPVSKKGSNSGCNAGSALMHITKSGSGYFENVWLWVADHDIDDPDWDDGNKFMTQCSVYVSRGLLVESQSPVWLYGTSSEHAIMYQYQFYQARHVYASMIQTESPYYQPNPRTPDPIPDASGRNPVGRDASRTMRVVESQDITIHGAGLYSWFDTYTQECVDKLNCQFNLIQFRKNKGRVSIHNLVTIGRIAVFDDRQVSGGTCKAVSNNTWINPDIHPGEYNTLRVLEEEDQLDYLTIVNGCLDEFEFRGGNDWQMDPRYKKEFFTVPAGESAQLLPRMETLTAADKRSDTAGESYYRIGRTDKKWALKAKWDKSKSMIRKKIAFESLKAKGTNVGTEADLGWPSLSYDRGLTNYFVLTGSEELGSC
ncbi:glucan 1,3-beta-glucosidase [Beauveria brongniartii RCEF 3172]|uniref:Glucan 1,3-beta-glucosidase n=1 Tax=Beauveria brongniartii RCEF 3172 TaxID=1081107 RepID=A0A162JKK3_9HYPO|nr:glucan 1,3-beta-glucosidase [Beauveria brongniartii RCEF 3172]